MIRADIRPIVTPIRKVSALWTRGQGWKIEIGKGDNSLRREALQGLRRPILD